MMPHYLHVLLKVQPSEVLFDSRTLQSTVESGEQANWTEPNANEAARPGKLLTFCHLGQNPAPRSDG
jgi:hypothetical protein